MANFAVIRDGIVINCVVGENKQELEAIFGFECIEYTDENPAIIGLGYSNGIFEQIVIPTQEVFDSDPS